MPDPAPLDPANAEELATLARETGAEVLIENMLLRTLIGAFVAWHPDVVEEWFQRGCTVRAALQGKPVKGMGRSMITRWCSPTMVAGKSPWITEDVLWSCCTQRASVCESRTESRVRLFKGAHWEVGED
jgi:hypothetical protein